MLSERGQRQAGFTLLEVIVALAVLSISLALLMRTLSGGFHHQRQAAMLAQKTALAQSLLARVGTDLPLAPGVQNGSSANGLAWEIRIEPYGDGADRQHWPLAAYTVSVNVREQGVDSAAYVLNTLRLAAKAPPR